MPAAPGAARTVGAGQSAYTSQVMMGDLYLYFPHARRGLLIFLSRFDVGTFYFPTGFTAVCEGFA